MSRPTGETGSHGMNDRAFNRPDSMNRQKGIEFQRPSAGETRSFSPPARGSERSFSSPPEGGSKHYGSSPMGSGGFSRSPQVGGHGSSFGYGGPRL
jgi:hypothetical protein